MSVRYVYAIINAGKVENTIDCLDGFEVANLIARSGFGDDAFAVEINQYRTQVGDFYHDGAFWRVNEETGKEIELDYVPTPEQQVEELESKTNELVEYQAEMLYEMSLMKLGIEE